MATFSIVLWVLGIICALVATVAAFIFIIPEKKRPSLSPFLKFLHDVFNFKFLIIEKILQFCYVLATAITVIGGFFSLFTFVEVYTWYDTEWRWIGYWGLVIMILGPIAVRVAYEIIMMAVLAVKNIIQINSKLKNQNEGESDDMFSTNNLKSYIPDAFQQKPQQAAPQDTAHTVRFCVRCGSILDESGTCPNCR